VAYYRVRFTEGLRKIRDEISLDTPGARQSALSAIETHTNFYLAYQGCDDRELQIQYGDLVFQIMAANYPRWTSPLRMPPTGGKLRIGYCSSCFRLHSVTKSHLAWLQEHNREQFLIYSYYMGAGTDFVTQDVRNTSYSFTHFPNDFEPMAEAIQADDLHILIFLDIGVHPVMTQLAALRLAPVQCATWGHPVTTGLPNVDYFLSSEIMEPENAQDYYSEKLVCLPGIGADYREPVIPTMLLNLTRNNFHIRDDAVVYLCTQSIFKYLPDHDDVFAQIAKRVPSAQFVFLTENTMISADFQRRLNRAFSAVDLDASKYCRVLSKYLSSFDYWNLYLLSDIYLDGIEWSGFNSTFDAVACNLPIVSMPGRFLRGRTSYALLTQLGMVDTIASDKTEYVEIAVRLGLDSRLRSHLVQRMISARPYLYADMRSIQPLEDFFRHVARDHESRT
jgi:protein O-GlcNAc transferase